MAPLVTLTESGPMALLTVLPCASNICAVTVYAPAGTFGMLVLIALQVGVTRLNWLPDESLTKRATLVAPYLAQRDESELDAIVHVTESEPLAVVHAGKISINVNSTNRPRIEWNPSSRTRLDCIFSVLREKGITSNIQGPSAMKSLFAPSARLPTCGNLAGGPAKCRSSKPSSIAMSNAPAPKRYSTQAADSSFPHVVAVAAC